MLPRHTLVPQRKSGHRQLFAISFPMLSLLSLVGSLDSVTAQQTGCMLLQGSAACSTFHDQYVWQSDGFSDMKTFDQYVYSKIPLNRDGIDFFKQQELCPNMQSSAELRYLQTTVCASLVYSATKKGCTQPHSALKLCKSSGAAAIFAIEAMVGSSDCIKNADRNASYYQTIIYPFVAQLDSDTECISSVPQEQYCGFPSTEAGFAFCQKKASTNPCCATLHAKVDTSSNAKTNSLPASSTAGQPISARTKSGALSLPIYVAIAVFGVALVIATAGVVAYRRSNAANAASFRTSRVPGFSHGNMSNGQTFLSKFNENNEFAV